MSSISNDLFCIIIIQAKQNPNIRYKNKNFLILCHGILFLENEITPPK